ncbi:MAG TPA: T9SS type A sorting domain-containing protein [Flavipsychrobacter sp.]|nr:T9SS type A sorting domain-containing protein [Flavipsychrobacter sp.]
MKKISCIVLLLFSLLESNIAAAQAPPPWRWVKRGGSMDLQSQDAVIDKATDRYGNVYILADNRRGLVNIDGHHSIGSNDKISLASWDCSGNFRWMKNYGGGGFATYLKGLSLGTDSIGNVYVSGQISITMLTDTIYFDSDTLLTNATSQRFFVIKYNTTGNMKWLDVPITTQSQSGVKLFEMEIAPSGHIYHLAQLAPGTYHNNSYSIQSSGYYVVQYDPNGLFQTVTKLDVQTSKALGGYPGNYFSFVRDHRNGRYYLSGSYNATTLGTNFMIGSTQIVTSDSFNYWPMYVAGFNAAGNSLWVKQGNSNITGWATLAPPDSKGNIYIGGLSHTGNSFIGHNITNGWGWSSVNYIIAADSNGNTIWGTNAWLLPTCTYPSNYYDITCTKDTVAFVATNNGQLKWGGLGLTITTQSAQGFLARFNATNGSILTLDSISSNELSEPTAVVMDDNANVFTSGLFRTSIKVGNHSAAVTDTILYACDWFVVKYGRNDTCKEEIRTTVNKSVREIPLVLFPNPAHDVIYFDNVGESYSVEIFSLTGVRMLQTTISAAQMKVNITQLRAGIYIIQLTNSKGKQHYTRFVKQE